MKNYKMKKAFLASTALAITAISANAETYTWQNTVVTSGTSLKWNDPSNWSPTPGSSGPGAADDVIFKDTPSFGTASAMEGLTAVNNMTFENATIINGERFQFHTQQSANINGDIFLGNLYTPNSWSIMNFRSIYENSTIDIAGSITLAPTKNDGTTAVDSGLSFGGTQIDHHYTSMNVGENAGIYSPTGYKTAILLDASKGNIRFEFCGTSVGDEDWATVHGVIQMNRGSNTYATLYLGRNETPTTKAGAMRDSHISIGGLNGGGKLITKLSSTADNRRTSYLTFTNAAGVNTQFTGDLAVETFSGSNNNSFVFIMDGAGSQSMNIGSGGDLLSAIEVKNGTMLVNKANTSASLTISGGAFGALDPSNGISLGSAKYSGGEIIIDASAIGGALGQIVLGDKFVSDAESVLIDFTNFDQYLLDDGIFYDIMTANGGFENSDGSAMDESDFIAKIDGAYAIFHLEGNTLQATFSSVPEPAELAALIGLGALALAVFGRHKRS